MAICKIACFGEVHPVRRVSRKMSWGRIAFEKRMRWARRPGRNIEEIYGYRSRMRSFAETDVFSDLADDEIDEMRENPCLVRRFETKRIGLIT